MVLLAIAAGVVIGYARGGRVRHLLGQRPARSRLLLTALTLYVIGVLGGWAWEPLLPILTALGGLVLGYFAWLNRRFEGAVLIAIGLISNALIVLVNGAMPISANAAARAGAEAVDLTDSRYMAMSDAMFPWLGKVIPIAIPVAPEVVSPGDIALAAGCGLVVVTCMAVIGRRQVTHQVSTTSHNDAPDRPHRSEPAVDATQPSASMASVPATHHTADTVASPPPQAGTG